MIMMGCAFILCVYICVRIEHGDEESNKEMKSGTCTKDELWQMQVCVCTVCCACSAVWSPSFLPISPNIYFFLDGE